jgi:hypothetical protein
MKSLFLILILFFIVEKDGVFGQDLFLKRHHKR